MAKRPFPSFLIDVDAAGEYRWHYQHSGNHKIEADSGEGYETYADCLAGINMIKKGAPNAQVWRTDAAAKKQERTG